MPCSFDITSSESWLLLLLQEIIILYYFTAAATLTHSPVSLNTHPFLHVLQQLLSLPDYRSVTIQLLPFSKRILKHFSLNLRESQNNHLWRILGGCTHIWEIYYIFQYLKTIASWFLWLLITIASWSLLSTILPPQFLPSLWDFLDISLGPLKSSPSLLLPQVHFTTSSRGSFIQVVIFSFAVIRCYVFYLLLYFSVIISFILYYNFRDF